MAANPYWNDARLSAQRPAAPGACLPADPPIHWPHDSPPAYSMAVGAPVSCPSCGTANPADAQFCMRCGTALTQRCLNCGATNALDAHFCLRCGTPLARTVAIRYAGQPRTVGRSARTTDGRLLLVDRGQTGRLSPARPTLAARGGRSRSGLGRRGPTGVAPIGHRRRPEPDGRFPPARSGRACSGAWW